MQIKTAQQAIESRHQVAVQMDELGRLPRHQRRGKRVAYPAIPPIYPEGIEISSPYAVSWGSIEALSVFGNAIKFNHEIRLGSFESHTPWGRSKIWLDLPAHLWSQIAVREGDTWYPKADFTGSTQADKMVGSMTALVWVQRHGTKGDHAHDWDVTAVEQVSIHNSDIRCDVARAALFDKLYPYRADGVGIDCLISAAQEDEQGDRIEFYGTYHGSSVEDALRRASEAHPTATVTIAPPVCCDEF